MPSDNDHVESGAQIEVPSMAAPKTVQHTAPIYPQVISPNFPPPSPMKCHGDVTGNWDLFKQQWSDYETATGLDRREESVRLATLRSSMGRECLQILLNLNLPEDDKKKIDKCLEALESYFKPSRNLVYERYVFNTCVQQSEESVQSYVTRLRKLAASCEYGALTDELIRDRLVIGLKNQGDKVDLKKAIQMCASSEIASQQIKTIISAGDKTEDITKFSEKKFPHRTRSKKRDGGRSSNLEKKLEKKKSGSPFEPTCKYRGRKQRHERRTKCPAFKKTCSKCQKKGHFASVCRSSKKIQQFEEDEDDSPDESCLQVETVSIVQTKAKQWLADISFFKSAKEDFTTTLACQLDTGATCNVIGLDDLSAITQLGDPPMNNSSVKLKLFGGTALKPVSECDLHVRHNGKQQILKFQVIKHKCKLLLSAETCEKLQLIFVNFSVPENVRQISETLPQKCLSKEELLSKYHEVFTGLGHIGDVKIMVDPSFKPLQHSPRRVPVALQKEVKNKILELEEKGIIKKVVEPSEWISSMVIVAKPQKIRICLDPKDLNRAIQRPKFQMPTLEELLPELNKARIFSSFDAKDGFYQVGLDQESCKLTTLWTSLGRYRYLRMPFRISLAQKSLKAD